VEPAGGPPGGQPQLGIKVQERAAVADEFFSQAQRGVPRVAERVLAVEEDVGRLAQTIAERDRLPAAAAAMFAGVAGSAAKGAPAVACRPRES
jgi:hypothetical protein